mmetsp:Transcript_5925/g.12973  ORF Transcript_5925/g.12973 Transcript_5925/m.12973 type:complete len:91 (+) Transcript_5925:134-406(+)
MKAAALATAPAVRALSVPLLARAASVTALADGEVCPGRHTELTKDSLSGKKTAAEAAAPVVARTALRCCRVLGIVARLAGWWSRLVSQKT